MRECQEIFTVCLECEMSNVRQETGDRTEDGRPETEGRIREKGDRILEKLTSPTWDGDKILKYWRRLKNKIMKLIPFNIYF